MSSLYEDRRVESETLSTFKKHRPSEYFSHLGDDDSFQAHHNRVELLYRYGLTFPPEYFAGRSVIDLGAGTGENTVSLAKWGALCTLVEINPEAIEVAKEVYRTHLLNHSRHTFINTSLFDLDVDSLKGSFDISHSREYLRMFGTKGRHLAY